MHLKFTDYNVAQKGANTHVETTMSLDDVRVMARFFGSIATRAMEGKLKLPDDINASTVLTYVRQYTIRPDEQTRRIGYNVKALEDMSVLVTRLHSWVEFALTTQILVTWHMVWRNRHSNFSLMR